MRHLTSYSLITIQPTLALISRAARGVVTFPAVCIKRRGYA